MFAAGQRLIGEEVTRLKTSLKIRKLRDGKSRMVRLYVASTFPAFRKAKMDSERFITRFDTQRSDLPYDLKRPVALGEADPGEDGILAMGMPRFIRTSSGGVATSTKMSI